MIHATAWMNFKCIFLSDRKMPDHVLYDSMPMTFSRKGKITETENRSFAATGSRK